MPIVPQWFGQYPGPGQLGNTDGLLTASFSVISGALAPSTGISNLVPTPCQVFGISAGNLTGGAAFLKLYDQGAVTYISGVQQTSLSGVSANMGLIIPGNAAGAGTNIAVSGMPWKAGIQFFNGVTALVTANAALADASAVSTGVIVSIWYK